MCSSVHHPTDKPKLRQQRNSLQRNHIHGLLRRIVSRVTTASRHDGLASRKATRATGNLALRTLLCGPRRTDNLASGSTKSAKVQYEDHFVPVHRWVTRHRRPASGDLKASTFVEPSS